MSAESFLDLLLRHSAHEVGAATKLRTEVYTTGSQTALPYRAPKPVPDLHSGKVLAALFFPMVSASNHARACFQQLEPAN